MIDSLDKVAYDPRFLPWQGWYGDFVNGPKGDIIGYAVQQDRQEFVDFCQVLRSKNITGSVLQLGLGCPGASHLCWGVVFNSVVSVESNQGHIDAFTSRVGNTPIILKGNTRDLTTVASAKVYAPFDCLFIDADHQYDSVRLDHYDYSPLVRKGGIVAFHDTVEHKRYGPENRAWQFVRELDNVTHIGYTLGISWYIKQ